MGEPLSDEARAALEGPPADSTSTAETVVDVVSPLAASGDLAELKIPDLPAPVDFENITLEEARTAIRERDTVIGQLREPLMLLQVAGQLPVDLPTLEHLPAPLKDRIAELEAQWQSKFRQASWMYRWSGRGWRANRRRSVSSRTPCRSSSAGKGFQARRPPPTTARRGRKLFFETPLVPLYGQSRRREWRVGHVRPGQMTHRRFPRFNRDRHARSTFFRRCPQGARVRARWWFGPRLPPDIPESRLTPIFRNVLPGRG